MTAGCLFACWVSFASGALLTLMAVVWARRTVSKIPPTEGGGSLKPSDAAPPERTFAPASAAAVRVDNETLAQLAWANALLAECFMRGES